MTDLILEIVRAVIVAGIVWLLVHRGKVLVSSDRLGWRSIQVGFALLLLGSVLDITDNFESLNRFVIVGDTDAEAFLEKLVGYLGGFMLLAFGLTRWIPSLVRFANESEERQAAEDSLAFSQERFKYYAEIASDWFWEMDENLRFSYLSDRFEEISGVRKVDLLGKTRQVSGLNPDDDLIKQNIEDLEAHRPFRDFEHSRTRPDGSVVHMSTAGVPIFDSDGRFGGYRGIGRDITDRKLAGAALEQASRQAEEANRAKSRFLAAASHDLRQPLQALNLFVGILKTSKDQNKQRETVDSLQASLDVLGNLLNALLDISKLDAGIVEPEIASFRICEIFTSREEFELVAQTKGLEFRIVSSDAIVVSDPSLLESIVRNLISNALHYTEAGGVLVGCRRRGANLRIEIHDTGIGISPEQRSLIFEEYYQVGNSARDRDQGLGLGLSTVDRTARR